MAVTCMFASAAAAQDAAGQCRGSDMLAELAISEPDVHSTLLQKAAELENAGALLWKIESKNGAVSQIFGTMHLSDVRLTTLSASVAGRIKNAKKIVLEVADLSDAALSEAMQASAPLIAYSDGQTLENKLAPAEFEKVKSVVAKTGMPGDFAKVLKPWLVNTLMAMSDCERKQIDSGMPVLDNRIAKEAKSLNIPVVGLETIEQQLSALASIPDDEQLLMLKAGLAYLDRTPDILETLLQLYMKRQMGAAMPFQIALAAKTGIPARAFDGFQKKLLIERNIKMLENMKPFLEEGGAFVAVGALHLPGKTGLVTLLKNAGYTVTPAE